MSGLLGAVTGCMDGQIDLAQLSTVPVTRGGVHSEILLDEELVLRRRVA